VETGFPSFIINRLAITTSKSLFASPGVGFIRAIAARIRDIAPRLVVFAVAITV
jgi:hypothetical protein